MFPDWLGGQIGLYLILHLVNNETDFTKNILAKEVPQIQTVDRYLQFLPKTELWCHQKLFDNQEMLARVLEAVARALEAVARAPEAVARVPRTSTLLLL